MFVFKTKVIVKELQKYAPLIAKQCNKAMRNSTKDLDFIRVEKNSFLKNPNIPIDKAVMEKTQKGIVIPLDVGWSDIEIGNLSGKLKKDENGNVIKGEVINKGSKNCYFNSEGRLLVTLGLKDLIVVESVDATFISNKENLDNLKGIVKFLDAKGYQGGGAT